MRIIRNRTSSRVDGDHNGFEFVFLSIRDKPAYLNSQLVILILEHVPGRKDDFFIYAVSSKKACDIGPESLQNIHQRCY